MDPAPQDLQLRRAGVPLANNHRDVGVSIGVDTGCWVIGAEAEGGRHRVLQGAILEAALITGSKPGDLRPDLLHNTEGLMPENQEIAFRRWGSVLAGLHLPIGAAQTDAEHLYQYAPSVGYIVDTRHGQFT